MQSEIPQLYFNVDRDRAKFLGIPLTDIFSTMKAYLGSVYVNDFNMFNRKYITNYWILAYDNHWNCRRPKCLIICFLHQWGNVLRQSDLIRQQAPADKKFITDVERLFQPSPFFL